MSRPTSLHRDRQERRAIVAMFVVLAAAALLTPLPWLAVPAAIVGATVAGRDQLAQSDSLVAAVVHVAFGVSLCVVGVVLSPLLLAVLLGTVAYRWWWTR
jgi:Na+/phosphate symporter